MLDKFTNKIIDKIYIELKKDVNKKKIDQILKPLTVKLFYIILPYLGIGMFLYLIVLLLLIYNIFLIKNISFNNI
jgi:hypothetical protein